MAGRGIKLQGAIAMRFRSIVPSALSAAGLLIAVYLTVLHYNRRVPLYCAGSAFNCRAVLGSPASVVFGVPVSVAGIIWFAVTVWVAVGMAGGVKRGRLLVFARGWTAAGMSGVLYFVYLRVSLRVTSS